jgi:hypothetical protein
VAASGDPTGSSSSNVRSGWACSAIYVTTGQAWCQKQVELAVDESLELCVATGCILLLLRSEASSGDEEAHRYAASAANAGYGTSALWRITPSIWPFWRRVIRSMVEFSGLQAARRRGAPRPAQARAAFPDPVGCCLQTLRPNRWLPRSCRDNIIAKDVVLSRVKDPSG